jgi:Xaa-Pro aminopeptidase
MSVHSQRLARLRERLAQDSLDALAVSNPSNVFYLSGFTGSAGALLVSGDRVALFSDFRYRLQAKEQASDYEFIEIPKRLVYRLGEQAKAWGIRLLGYEAGHLTCEARDQLAEGAGDVELAASSPVESLRAVKSPDEIELIREAVSLADEAMKHMAGLLQPGAAEREIALEGEFHMRRIGAEAASFNFIVASGPRSALPHAETTERRLQPGDLVVIDIGARAHGYCSDITRTFAISSTDERARDVYAIVYRAQRAAAAAIRAGAVCMEVDGVARSMIADAGYGEAFGHGLGHGVGIDVHEAPRLTKGEETHLLTGNVVTVEPGIYLEGFGGVRLEDMVRVGEDGAETLTASPMADQLPVI